MKTLSFSLVLIICLSGCHRHSLLKINATSMKYRNLPAGASLNNIGPLKAEYCMAYFEKDSGEDIGLIDEVIKVAQKKYDIDFILNPHFTYSGKCIYVSGDGAKIK